MKKFLLITEDYVLSLVAKKLDKKYLFHNESNIQRVVNSVKELITGEKISEVDANILLFASWFHDVGYVNRRENHVEASVNIATTFLEEYNIDNSIIDAVVKLIRTTKLDVNSDDFLGKVFKDAISSYYADNSFLDKSVLLKEETNLLFNKNYSELEWIQKNINKFVKEHRFYTSFAQENWQQGKDKNLAKLVKIEKKLLKEKLPENNLKTAVKLYNSLTTKATILLAVNGLIIFLSLSKFCFNESQLETELTPITILLVFNSISAFLAMFVAFPFNLNEISNQGFLNQKINSKNNILKYTYIIFLVGIITSILISYLFS